MSLAVSAPHRDFLRGSMLALLAGTLWSFGGLTVRLAPDSDAWQYLIWRSAGLGIAVEAWSVLQGRGLLTPRFFGSGWIGWLAAICLSLAAVTFIFALKTTSVANALFLTSITPLLAVVLARAVLGEKLDWVTFGAIAVALIGVVVMVRGELGAGNLVGNVSAMLSSLGFAVYSVCVRREPGRDWLPSLVGYAWMTLLVCAAVTLVNGRTLVPPIQDVAMASLHGAVFIGVGITLFNLASPHVPAVGLTVLAQTEIVLAPIWVYLALGETPLPTTLAGGALILSAVFGMAIAGGRKGLRKEPPPSPPTPA
jgi:drug/metabolite transporter (DMT)-like permease